MANKRMFSQTIIDSDLFLDMSLSAQALYFHLSLRADDEGFINSPKKIMRMIGTRDDDLKILIAKQFILPFESGVVVIKHWLIHNSIRKDRIKATFHKLEKEQLKVCDDIYELETNGDYCQPSNDQLEDNTQQNDRIGLGLGLDLDLDIDIDKKSTNKFDDDSIEIVLVKTLYNLMQNNCKSKKPNFNNWAKEIEKMIRLDERSIEDIEKVITFSQNDRFWKSNIRSTAKLREKFDTLYLQMNNQQQTNNNNQESDLDQLKRLRNQAIKREQEKERGII